MEIAALARVFFALIAVLGMIALAAFIARKSGLARGAAALSSRKRLALVESLALDARRRAVLLRCDGREHLIILGPSGETLVSAQEIAGVSAKPEPLVTPSSFTLSLARLGAISAANPFAQKQDGADDAEKRVA